MPVYASTSHFTQQRRHPRALLLIIGGHAALIAAVMSAKMAIPIIEKDGPIIVRPIPVPPDPPPNPEPPKQTESPQPPSSTPYKPTPEVPIPAPGPEVDTTPIPIPPNTGPIITKPDPAPPFVPAVVRTGPRWATPEWAVKPPYPDDKRRLNEEAVLRLKLSIDERGRVVSVEPAERVDRSFFEAARKHVIAHWRYRPATEDGRPVASSTVVTLRFQLES
jgi:periplasmic protein TonB